LEAWERRSAGPGAQGQRLYDWTVLTLDSAGLIDGLPAGWGHWLLVRRQIDPPPGAAPALAFYRCAGPVNTPVPELIRVAAARWAIEECFQTAKNEAGLDHYQVRSYRAWYAPHHPGHARRRLPGRHPRTGGQKGGPTSDRSGLIPLTSAEIRRLLAALALTSTACLSNAISWSTWRRHRQHQARTCHYRRRGHRPP
jgi:hypothetical protein